MPVRIERSDRVRTVIQSRPDVRSAVDPAHADALYDAFVAFDADEAADVAVFWGEGDAFCAGADLKSLAARGIATSENTSMDRSLEFPKNHAPGPRGSMGPLAWGVPLTNGGTVRLPRLVGEGRALELAMAKRKVGANERLRIGRERAVRKGQAQRAAEDMARTIVSFRYCKSVWPVETR
jgi:enoyl-CoA hydratase